MRIFQISLLYLFFSAHFTWAQTIYLIGDAGKINKKSASVFKALQKGLKEDNNVSILILGDNIYSEGLVSNEGQEILDRQLSGLKNIEGLKLFLPGNHDWHNSKKEGLLTLKNQEAYIESYGDSSYLFSPNAGEPGPEWFSLSNDILLVSIDTQWWIHKFEKDLCCTTCSESHFLEAMDSLFLANQNKQIIVAGHHPLYSLGHHGGHFSFKDHMEPFPLVGSSIILSKWLFPSRQEINNRKFKSLKRGLETIFEKNPETIYVSGHDHSLQYLKRKHSHYLISGSSSKSTYVKEGKGVDYTYEGFGFMKLKLIGNKRELYIYSDEGILLKTILF